MSRFGEVVGRFVGSVREIWDEATLPERVAGVSTLCLIPIGIAGISYGTHYIVQGEANRAKAMAILKGEIGLINGYAQPKLDGSGLTYYVLTLSTDRSNGEIIQAIRGAGFSILGNVTFIDTPRFKKVQFNSDERYPSCSQ